MPRHRAFTLVELLVVITIVTLLVALLLPALRAARNAAFDTKCLANLRQVAIGVLSYSNDFSNETPRHYASTGGANGMYQHSKAPRNLWAYWSEGPKPFNMRAGAAWPSYLVDANLFYCPDNRYRNAAASQWMKPGMSFHMRFSSTFTFTGFKWWGNSAIGQAYAGQYYVSYAFPAVDDGPLTQTNFGRYPDPAPNYWDTTNYWESYTTWRPAMVKPRVDDNVRNTAPMVWDCTFDDWVNHEFRNASVVYFDGSGLPYPGETVRNLYQNYTTPQGAQGLVHPSIVSYLSRYLKSRFLPP